MPVNPTFPGVYIEEVPNQSRTITAASTSVAVFVGYTHPFKTKNAGKAVQIFNFTEYEREFGGLYRSSKVASDVAYAVYQFFLNGGSTAYVVGIAPTSGGIAAMTVNVGATNPIVLTAREPTEATGSSAMTVTVTNVRQTTAANDTADLQIAYGSRSETFRGLVLGATGSPSPTATTIARLNTSSLVSAVTSALAAWPAAGTVLTFPANTASTNFAAADFNSIFAADSSLDKVAVFNILALPGVSNAGVLATALNFAEGKRAFTIIDPPSTAIADGTDANTAIGELIAGVPKSPNGALYFPYLKSSDPLSGEAMNVPPSGFVAGIYARTDVNRGVWKAPAGLETTVSNTTGVVDTGRMTDLRHGVLNPKGVNCLRTFPATGTVVFGARTLVTENTALQQWRYVPVRRTALFIEQTLYANLGWAVFEPNDLPLWTAIRTSIDNFMLSLFRQGAFQGQKPSDAFLVKCDATTTTQTDIDNGIVNVLVGFRPLKPAEFVIIKISQLAGQVQA